MQNNELINKIEIVRSSKRKKTVSARLKNGIMYVNAPAHTPEKELHKIIDKFKNSFIKKNLRKKLNQTQNLSVIAEKLNKEYFAGKLKIASIEYSTNQNSRFGCCNVRTHKILISHVLAKMPDWVRDYVIIHELAHLIVPNHSKAFHELTERYKLSERAKGYLLAKGYNEQEIEQNEENEVTDN